MQTIETKYLGATNTMGARIKATTSEGISYTMNYNYALGEPAAHIRAAKALAEKLGWEDEFVGGHTKNGMVFVIPGGYNFSTLKNERED